MNIVEEALKIRNAIKSSMDFDINPIDDTLSIIPSFKGKAEIKLIIIGQDPTIKNINSRKNISCTLNLDKNNSLRTYVDRICTLLEINIENVYATNLYKYFYTLPPANTPEVLKSHLQPNLDLLKQEIDVYSDVQIITFGEPVLQLLTTEKEKVHDYWDYNLKKKTTDANFRFLPANENKLGRDFFPFPHQPSIRKVFYNNTLENYISFMRSMLESN